MAASTSSYPRPAGGRPRPCAELVYSRGSTSPRRMLRHVVEDEDDALDAAAVIRDGRRRVVDRAAGPVPGREAV